MTTTSYLERLLQAQSTHRARPAIVETEREVSHGELASLARRMAHLLVERQALPRVLIHLPQGAEAYAAMIAAALAGGFYSTTNVAAPVERRRAIFANFAPAAVITTTELAAEAKAWAPHAAIVAVEALGTAELATPAAPHPTAYVMFTSGSTGAPKGVVIAKSALSHYVDWVMSAMAVVPEDRWSQHPNIAFDLSVLDIYGALCAGAALVPITGADLLMPAQAMRRHRLTIWDSVPSVMTSMIKLRQLTARNCETVRLFTFCGEPLQRLHVESIFAARPDAGLHNTYGPTEATVSCTLVRLTPDNYAAATQSSVAIGAPIADMDIDLAGGPDADEGEIVISGPQLADGYWNDPVLTAQKFRPHRVAGREKRGYFTGDWGKRIGDHIYFRGRTDFQVKIRGERVELEDIGAALMACVDCFACALLIDEEVHGVFERAAAPGQGEAALRTAIAAHLPHHLAPRHFHWVPDLPRNANGKVDIPAVDRMVRAVLARREQTT